MSTIPLTEQNDRQWDETVDVLVIGSGFAGLAAAIEAGQQGASVLVLEKMKVTGGNSRISDGGIAAPETDLQAARGIVDSRETMLRDMLASGLGLNQPDLVQTVVDHAREAFEWSRNTLGVAYLDRVDIFGGHSARRCYTTTHISGADIISKQLQRLEALGVEVRTRCRFDGFVRAPAGGPAGARVLEGCDPTHDGQGTVRLLGVNRGIVLATGGYGADIAFRTLQDPRLTADIDTTNRPSATAEALKAALGLGAAPVHLSHIQLGPWGSPDEKGYGFGPMFSEYVVFQYGMIVDPATGGRFINELADRKTLSDHILSKGHPCIGIADAAAVATAGWDIGKALKRKVVREFATVEPLARAYDIPVAALNASIAAFNRIFDDRIDHEFGKPVMADAQPFGTAPFYAIRLWPKVHHVSGGLGINTRAQVIDLEGRPIAGLFAAGEVAGGIHGACRLGSCAITECLVFGRIAGRNAAAQVKP